MGFETGISWADHTFNPWWGCVKVGNDPCCDNCYAERDAMRYGWADGGAHFRIWGNDAPRRHFTENHWDEPIKWNRAAQLAGEMRHVFCSSFSDWAEGRPDQADDLRHLWDLQRRTQWLIWMMLTKRPQLIGKLCPMLPSPRLWMGTSAGDQGWFDLRWEHLKRVPASVYWFSLEPLVGPIKLPEDFCLLGKRAWVIVGGESGSNYRGLDLAHVRSLRDQCLDHGIAFHFKQMSGTSKKQREDIPIDLQIRQYPVPSLVQAA